MAKNRFLLYIAALMLVSLACGVNTQLPQNTPEVLIVGLSPTSEPILNQYIVTAETLRIRDGAGESFPLLGYLENGQIVTCQYFTSALDGGLWCRHEKGWSNIRYMKGIK